jgi:hypothetical protein
MLIMLFDDFLVFRLVAILRLIDGCLLLLLAGVVLAGIARRGARPRGTARPNRQGLSRSLHQPSTHCQRDASRLFVVESGSDCGGDSPAASGKRAAGMYAVSIRMPSQRRCGRTWVPQQFA